MMYKNFSTLLCTGLLFLAASACSPSTSEQQKADDQTATQETPAPATAESTHKDTLQVSAGADGVNVKSNKVDVDVNKKGTEVKTKDVKVKLGDKK